MPNLLTEVMNETIRMPGFPAIIVSRHFCYQFLKQCGWSEIERGIGSLDYMTFATPKVDGPVTDDETRDFYMAKVRHDFERQS